MFAQEPVAVAASSAVGSAATAACSSVVPKASPLNRARSAAAAAFMWRLKAGVTGVSKIRCLPLCRALGSSRSTPGASPLTAGLSAKLVPGIATSAARARRPSTVLIIGSVFPSSGADPRRSPAVEETLPLWESPPHGGRRPPPARSLTRARSWTGLPCRRYVRRATFRLDFRADEHRFRADRRIRRPVPFREWHGLGPRRAAKGSFPARGSGRRAARALAGRKDAARAAPGRG